MNLQWNSLIFNLLFLLFLLDEKVSFIKNHDDENNGKIVSILSSAVTRTNPKEVMTIPSADLKFD